MMEFKVGVFPAGTEIGLEIHNALRFVKNIELVGISSAVDHSDVVYENIINGAPYVNDSEIVSYLNTICEDNKIDCLFPAHDEVVNLFCKEREAIKANLIIPNGQAGEICRSKKMTYKALEKFDFIPKLFAANTISVNDLPVFCKPDIGQGSNGAVIIETEDQLMNIDFEKSVVCEYLPGKEFTVDCVSDLQNQLLYCGQRERARVKSGISVSSTNMKPSLDLIKIAESISKKLTMTGAWFFQVKFDQKGKLKLLEVAARVAGTMGLHRNLGINFPLLSIYISNGINTTVIENDLRLTVDRALISRYKSNLSYDKVYIDYDDTVLLAGKVNAFIMQFIYQCHNKNIDVYLITRHSDDINNSLRENCIPHGVFKEIIHIKNGDKKSLYINPTNSIFIDDSYSERAEVSANSNIPVFDLDSIELLLDWKL